MEHIKWSDKVTRINEEVLERKREERTLINKSYVEKAIGLVIL